MFISFPHDPSVLGFLNYRTRVLQATACAKPCLEHFQVRVHTTTGWIPLLLAIVAEPAPRHAQHAAHLLHHHADRPTGLYTEHAGVAASAISSRLLTYRDCRFGAGWVSRVGELPLDTDPWRNETVATPSSVAHLAYRDRPGPTIFLMVSGALFLLYVAYQKCKQSATTPGAGATYNYMSQAAPTPSAVTTTAIHQEIQVGGAPTEAAPAEPHQGGCNEF